MRICPGHAMEDADGCVTTDAVMGGGVESKILNLVQKCAIAADVSAFMQNPTTLDVRLDRVFSVVQFDDTSGVPLLGYDKNTDNILGTVNTDYKGALIKGRELVRLPVALIPVPDT